MKIEVHIDEAIEKSGLHKKYIAGKIGVSVETLANWRKGRTFPKVDQAYKLAELVGEDIKSLYVYKK